MIRSVTLFCLLLLASLCAAQEKVGQPAPTFTLRAVNVKSVSLAAYSGKVVLLNFWATWCGPCQTEMPRFVRFQREYASKGFQVIGVSMDDSEAPVRIFISKLKPNYPIAMGNTKLAESYGGILGLPITLLIDRKGNIVRRYEGAIDLDAMQQELEQLLKAGDSPGANAPSR